MESKNGDLKTGRGRFAESVPLEVEKSEMGEGIWVLRKRVEGGFMFLGIEAATAKKERTFFLLIFSLQWLTTTEGVLFLFVKLLIYY